LVPTLRRNDIVVAADTEWVEPRFEAEVVFTEITSHGMLRLPSFKALVSC
jgi:hypothetical protein